MGKRAGSGTPLLRSAFPGATSSGTRKWTDVITLSEEHRFWMLVIITPGEAPAGRVPSLQDSPAPLQIQTVFQEGSPSHPHSFKRLSSSERVLFLPSYHQVFWAHPSEEQTQMLRRSRRRSRRRRRRVMTEGQERRKDGTKFPRKRCDGDSNGLQTKFWK